MRKKKVSSRRRDATGIVCENNRVSELHIKYTRVIPKWPSPSVLGLNISICMAIVVASEVAMRSHIAACFGEVHIILSRVFEFPGECFERSFSEFFISRSSSFASCLSCDVFTRERYEVWVIFFRDEFWLFFSERVETRWAEGAGRWLKWKNGWCGVKCVVTCKRCFRCDPYRDV